MRCLRRDLKNIGPLRGPQQETSKCLPLLPVGPLLPLLCSLVSMPAAWEDYRIRIASGRPRDPNRTSSSVLVAPRATPGYPCASSLRIPSAHSLHAQGHSLVPRVSLGRSSPGYHSAANHSPCSHCVKRIAPAESAQLSHLQLAWSPKDPWGRLRSRAVAIGKASRLGGWLGRQWNLLSWFAPCLGACLQPSI